MCCFYSILYFSNREKPFQWKYWIQLYTLSKWIYVAVQNVLQSDRAKHKKHWTLLHQQCWFTTTCMRLCVAYAHYCLTVVVPFGLVHCYIAIHVAFQNKLMNDWNAIFSNSKTKRKVKAIFHDMKQFLLNIALILW